MLSSANIARYLKLGSVSPSLLTGLLVLSLGFNVVMARRVRSLVARLEHSTSLKTGDSAPSIPLVDLEGRSTRLAYDVGRSTILYYFSSDCPWSRRNSSNIAVLAANTRQNYRFISYTSAAERYKRNQPAYTAPMPVLTDCPDGPQLLRREYKLLGTPQTLVISNDGHVIRNWQGAYSGKLKSEIERFFGVQLPGLAEVSGR